MRRLVMFLCVVALAGCGGDGGGGGESKSAGKGGGGGDERLTQAEFSAKGEQICKDGAKRTEELVKKELAKDEVKQMGDVERRLHLVKANQPVVDETMSEIEALEAPAEAEPHVKKLTSGVREVVEVLAGVDDRKELAASTQRLEELAVETREAARAAGLEACLPENTN